MADFSDVAELISGVTFKKADSKSEKLPGTIGVLRAGNIQDSEVIMDDVVYVPERFVKSSQQLKEGDVLIASSSGSLDVVGKAAAVQSNVNVAFGAFCKVARPKREVVFPAYFKHFFRSTGYKREVRERAEGANINNLNRGDFLSLQIPLPQLEEQKRIAGILDEADRVRKKTQALIDKYDELAQSLFLDMFGDPVTNPKRWEVKSLGEACNVNWGNTSLTKSSFDENGDFLGVSAGGIDGRISHAEHDAKTIVISAIGARCGRLFFPKQPFTAIKNTMTVEPKLGLDSKFVFSMLSLIELPKRGAAQPFLALKEIRQVPVILPDFALQSKFDDLIQDLSNCKVKLEQILQNEDTLFNSLLQKAFKGELN